ncbi:YqhG family protein [Psychrobacillus sp.]|uniref:YqhG family protein n=1 Tax=Psychrobacillus sp. TaxID=1871623 RepID=UPI0028BF4ED2|nr:YqhG family protein [Psychrobacillus sp.]
MYPQQVHKYLSVFFKETSCQILSNHPDYITVQLTIDMDKKIMNRPFYWRNIESTGGVPNPALLNLITDQNKLGADVKGEVVHFGSPRLNRLFQTTKELGAFVLMYERVLGKGEAQTILTPWLGVNYKVSYYSDQTMEMLYSFGINLITGIVREDFQESLHEVNLETYQSKHTFNLPFIIKPVRGLERLDKIIEQIIEQDDHLWAEEAKGRWQKDQDILEYFYEGMENKPECYEMEKQAMKEQYEARIKIEIINGGLFYMK